MSPYDFINLSYTFSGEKNKKFFNDYIFHTYNNLINKYYDDGKILAKLFEQAPISVLIDVNKIILFDCLIKLLEYDESKWFKDNSSAVEKALISFNSPKILLDKFLLDQSIILRLFSALDGESTWTDDEPISRKMLFANIFEALCLGYGYDKLTKSNATFYYYSTAKITSFSLLGLQTEKDTFYLEQQYLEEDIAVDAITPSLNWVGDNKGAYYHPLDIVTLIDGNGNARYVPAIVVKALAHDSDMIDLQRNLRIAGDILGVILGLASLSTGNPLMLSLAIADLGLTMTDIGVQLKIEDIKQLDGGEEYIKLWEKIFIYGTIATASPLLINAFIKSGNKLLKIAVSTSKYRYLRLIIYRSFFKVINELRFKGTLMLIKMFENAEEIKNNFGLIYSTFAADLLESGVVFTRVEETTENGTKVSKLLATYKESVIAEGTIKDVSEKLLEFKKYGRGEKLENALEVLNNKTILLSNLIKNTEELVDLLRNIDNSFFVEDLEKVGINVLFRGTTKTSSSIFKGTKNAQLYGLSTSTDPLRAIIFGVESSTGERQGILQIFIPNKMKGVYLSAPNNRVRFELEVVLNSSSKKLEKYAVKEIPIQKARELANKYFKLNGEMEITNRIKRVEADYLMEKLLPKTSLEDSYKFYQELIKY